MDPVTIDDVNRYLEAMEDPAVLTLDQVAERIEMERDRARVVHDALFSLFTRMSKLDTHRKAWATVQHLETANQLIAHYNREVQNLTRLQEEAANKEEREQSAYKVKELSSALNSAIQTVQKLALQLEDVHKSYQDREAVGNILRCMFDVLRKVDPVIAVRCRQSILDKFEELALVVPGG